MNKEITIEQILDEADSLYNTYEETKSHIDKYIKKYGIEPTNSRIILNLLIGSSHSKLLNDLIAQNLNEARDYIVELHNQIVAIRKLNLSEIAHVKSKEIKYQLYNPFFFRNVRKDYRILLNELNDLDDDAKNTVDFENFDLKFENVIERLRNLEYEIEDEKKSGLYGVILKIGVWGIPILIGFYQLIAMKYIVMNPYLPLLFYVISLLAVYFLLQSFVHAKLLYVSLKSEKFKSSLTIAGLFLIIFTSATLINIYNKGFELNEQIDEILSISLLLILIVSIAKGKIGKIKNNSTIKEFKDLQIKYGIKENRETTDAFSLFEIINRL